MKELTPTALGFSQGNKMDAKLLELQAKIIAVQVEVEGMKAANDERKMQGYALAYPETSFVEASTEIKMLADEIMMHSTKNR